MKLIFKKDQDLEISVTQENGGEEKGFNYVHMIKSLIKEETLEEPEMIGDFSDSEKESVNSMIAHINKEVAEFFAEDKE